jgi:hypothetical protein
MGGADGSLCSVPGMLSLLCCRLLGCLFSVSYDELVTSKLLFFTCLLTRFSNQIIIMNNINDE